MDNSTGPLTVANSIVQGFTALGGVNNQPFDPLFADLAGGDFQLTPYSPAIDTGNSAAVADDAVDLAGQPRIFGALVDLGAFEYQSAPLGVLAILGLPQSRTNCATTDAEFDIVTAPGDTNVFQWQVWQDGDFVPVPDAPPYALVTSGSTNALTLPAVSVSANGSVFRFANVDSGYVSPSFSLGVTPPVIIYVNANAATPGDGSTWETALTNIQTAFLRGDVCSEIWVAAGTYPVTLAPDGSPSLAMKKGLRVYGGFAGYETDPSQRDWVNNVAVLQAYTNAAVILNNASVAAIDKSALLDGFTIDGGNSSGNAVLNINASPTFRNCVFVHGSPGMWNTGGSRPIITDCVFSNNLQALANVQGSAYVSNCLFIANSGGLTTGGAIRTDAADLTIVDSQFLTNSAGVGAALSFDDHATALVTRCVFEGNTGGAIYSVVSTTLFTDDLVADNSSFQGGAVTLVMSTLVLNNCTVAGNSASSLGGGVFNYRGSLLATNTIFWNNSDLSGVTESAQIHNESGTNTLSHSIVNRLAAYAGNQNAGFDPLFEDAPGNNFTPGSFSPAVEAGDDSAVAPGDLDLAGHIRVAGGAVDIGAVELQDPTGATPVRLALQPQAQATCPGGAAAFTVTGGPGDGGLFVWEVDMGGGFQEIPADGYQFASSDDASATVAITNTPAEYNYDYRFQIPSAGISRRCFT